MLAARGHYIHSTLALRAPGAALLLPAALSLTQPGLARLPPVLAVYLAATLLTLLVSARRMGPTANRSPIPWRERLQGLQYLGSAVTAALSDRLVLSLSGLFLASASVAAFAAMALLVRPFALVRNVLRTVSIPELIRGRGREDRFLFLWTLIVATVAALAALLVAPPLLARLYAGRYLEGLALVPWLALAGARPLAETVPRSAVIGRATHGFNRVSIVAIVLTFISTLATGAWFVARLGLLGAAWAMVLVNAGSFAISGLFWRRHRRQETIGPPRPQDTFGSSAS